MMVKKYGGNIIKAYRKKFAVDRSVAIDELKALGAKMPEELVEKEKASARRITQEKARQRKRKRENKKKKRQDKDVFDDIMDDHFSFIAGYTAGGAPFGTTWEEIGIDQSLSFEEKVKLYLEL